MLNLFNGKIGFAGPASRIAASAACYHRGEE
jgi:hypothetical protein